MFRSLPGPIACGCLLIAMLFAIGASPAWGQDEKRAAALELFNRRILPIFGFLQPSSCVQCHLSTVDLKNYILPSQEKTFASLRAQGLVDIDNPQASKILTLIRMGEKDLDKGARLIHEKTRRAEYEAFAAWIEACSSDPDLRSLPAAADDQLAKPAHADEVIRHARKSRLVDSFERHIWSQRMRCFPCHTPHEIDPANPKHQAALKTHREMKEKYGEQISRLWLFRETPAATLQNLIEQSREPGDGLPLINLKAPGKSLLVLKPTSKLPAKKPDGTFEPPSSIDPVSHMGGLKMHADDHSYKAFLAWIQDYADVVQDRYASVEQLPADNWQPTQLILKLMETPGDWPIGTPVQLFLHARNEADDTWESEPLAFTQGVVTPRHIVNGAMFLFNRRDGAKGNGEPSGIPRGDYLVRVYVDTDGQLRRQPAMLLSSDAYRGGVHLNVSRWREGFPRGLAVSAKKLLP